ncbi:MAG: HPF/RaiA family ribosome-associated protein [Alphaproteobacteria bacterium]
MDAPLEIAFHNMDSSDALEQKIRERVERLNKRYHFINSCHVTVDVPHRNPAEKAREYHVRVEVRVPDKELVVSRDPGDIRAHFDPYIAVRDAFDAMERQLEQFSQKIRRDVKTHQAPLQGRILRLFPDHGFVATTDGREIYFHRNAVVDARFDDLEPDAPVELSLVHGESPMGPQATTVRPIRPMEFVPEPPRTA